MSSMNTECFRSPAFTEREEGVICSATQAGFRVRRSKADVVDGVGCRSETGPGNPYWKSPAGLTAVRISLVEKGCWSDVEGGGEVAVGIIATGVADAEGALRSPREEKKAAVAAAPVAAETPAMIADVVFDILTSRVVSPRFFGEKASSYPLLIQAVKSACGNDVTSNQS